MRDMRINMKNKKKILIIEDEAFLSEMYKMKFELEGYKVIIARDGQEGIESVFSDKPDIILLDLVMPIKDGYQVLEELKSNKDTKNIPVLILSNLGQADEIKRAMNDGADKYLIKANMTPNQLVKEVKDALI